MKSLPVILWLFVLAGSLAIGVLFFVQVNAHPRSLLMRVQSDLSYVQKHVVESEREDAKQIHDSVFMLFKRCVGGFGAAVDIAGVMVIISGAGLVMELKRRKLIQSDVSGNRRPGSR
jgi:hypothetical protein